MDQHRDVLASGGRQAVRAHIQNNLQEMRKHLTRLHAMRPQYRGLMQGAEQNLRDAHVLKEEIDAFVRSHEPFIPFEYTP